MLYKYKKDTIYFDNEKKVMKNKLSIEDEKLLEQVEHKIAMKKMVNLRKKPVALVTSSKRLLDIHKYIFGDIYEWAGKIRQVELSKGNTDFLPASAITLALTSIDESIGFIQGDLEMPKAVFMEKLAALILDLNHIHPFREGNGRATRELIREIAHNHGYSFKIDTMAKAYMDASIEDSQDLMKQVLDVELVEKRK